MIKNSLWTELKIYAVLLISAILRAFAIQVMLLPNNIAVGGVVGLSHIIYHFTHLPIGIFIIALNIPLLIVSYFLIGKMFAFRTMLSVVTVGGLTILFDLIKFADIINISGVKENLVLFSIVGGVMMGIALGMSFYSGASTGGTDVIALLIQRKHEFSNIMRVILIFDVFTLAIVGIVLNSFESFLYSVVTLLVTEISVELFQRGFASAVIYEIITDKPIEMVEALSTKIKRGVTSISVKGMYSHTDKTLLLCVVRKRQVNSAKKLIKEVDPAAFAYSVLVREVIGKGFRNIEV